jgi:hypothetical protein
MVTDTVWLSVNHYVQGMLCIGCLEKRLGRKLTPPDFTLCPLNNNLNDPCFPKSARLLNRLLGGQS